MSVPPPQTSTNSLQAAGPQAAGVMPWLQQVMGVPKAALHLKLRGNILHLLCQTPEPLAQTPVLLALVRALLEPQGSALMAQAYPQVYQIYLYNRAAGQPIPAWTAPIYLNRLERHLAQLVLESQDAADLQATQALLETYTEGDPERRRSYAADGAGGAIVLSNLSLARKGDPDAIAWYLSETLSALDVGVWVSVKAVPGTAQRPQGAIAPPATISAPAVADSGPIPRLWILCEAVYSPDPSLIARPTAERLRQLRLNQFKDAVLLLQVRGETTPDWRLRIDLTPPEEMLREWGRWGDPGAIAGLLEPLLRPLQLAVTADLKDTSLHLVCHPLASASLPAWESVQSVVLPLLESVAPQGIHRLMVYGQSSATAETPQWVGVADLPAAEHAALAPTASVLASSGDLPAIAFLLTRLLNPNQAEYLATGGLRVQLLLRDKLLHVMIDGPVAPQRRQVVPPVSQRLKQLQISGIQGARIYGRRSGQPQPNWSYGADFVSRRRLVPEAAPEFTASDAYVNELLQPPAAAGLGTEEAEPSPAAWHSQLWQKLRQGLLRSHLFAPENEAELRPIAIEAGSQDGMKIAVVWGAVGLLLALQMDWLLGQVLQPPTGPGVAEATEPAPTATPPSLQERLAELNWGGDPAEGGFGQGAAGGAFTTSGEADGSAADLPKSPQQPLAITDDLLLTSPYPSFRSQQLDEKLALYHQRLAQEGPADVLIVGSSRALRGVDPAALQQQLEGLGYEDISVFNFGVNGATAQVVDLILRRLLPPEQLPKVIIWADGARAFNSGREDVTYNAIAASEGYRELLSGELANSPAAEASTAASDQGIAQSLASSYQSMDQWLSQQLAALSAVHTEREQLKQALQQQFSGLAGPLARRPAPTEEALDAVMPADSFVDFDGFLALSVRFNPATYYQKHARVQGLYDGDYESFRLEGQQIEAFKTLLAFTQEQQIPLVFLNTPLTDEYLDDYRSQAEEAFLQYMLRVSTSEEGFIFRDLAQVWSQRYDYFSDPSHLNRYGAYQVSRSVAQDPMVPWPKAVPKSEAGPDFNAAARGETP